MDPSDYARVYENTRKSIQPPMWKVSLGNETYVANHH